MTENHCPRLPAGRHLGVDADPLLLGLAEGAVTGTDIRLLARDLTASGWADEIGPASWDAAVSSTAPSGNPTA
ncbi:hypothetical protein [Streptomyces sp. ID05-18]|uniref:hypothetical protein n=1 Tax=Streptomyces sp. ID05-18 TaxID=3028662 RepID=UPI0029BC94E9|nr:hypothetical protein [Streptomyces sp. ID05-18]MDX3486532.1 hypothetical protein [Streptomyces sp. ID05-18]